MLINPFYHYTTIGFTADIDVSKNRLKSLPDVDCHNYIPVCLLWRNNEVSFN